MTSGPSIRAGVDLNADVGEGGGEDERLIPLITSANIASGGHAGDAASMARAVDLAIAAGAAVGAHPGLEDRENFGRIERRVSPLAVRDLVWRQGDALRRIAEKRGVRVEHVKPHGALYHMATRDPAVASAIVEAVAELGGAIVFAPPGSVLAAAARTRGLPVAEEVFADRRYRADGTLVPRGDSRAMIEDRDEAVAQALGIILGGRVRVEGGPDIPLRADTICLHGDSGHAVAFARQLRAALRENGVEVRRVRARVES